MNGSSNARPSFRKPPASLTNLLDIERRWVEKQPFLESKGYMLRDRLRPGWKPSWETTGKSTLDSEDAIVLPARPHLVDAVRMSDKTLVYIKRVGTNDQESRIAMMLSAPKLRKDKRNHCVPIWDMFEDDVDSAISYIVMPFLKLMDEPPFYSVGEVIDFVDQILEGLRFLHEQGVAHRDCSRKNLMMDASAMYPNGFHPVKQRFMPDAVTPVWPRSRSAAGVTYYYVDFGISVYIPPDQQSKLATGNLGRDRDPPELWTGEPYDPFKLDIFIIGNVFRKEFHEKFSNVDFLFPLIDQMTQHRPQDRPDAATAFRQWELIRGKMSSFGRSWRLQPRNEGIPDKVALDIVSFARWIFWLN
ncbi:hypothetical protein NM688_g3268 [Phlebia brevispora]|uniref:Uncharacterized protein n=1 Tax=Phlebia brevispora TaxID=194682 RepID=A0ACC1T6E0_9APHY|nr:hypothetical protein NM688_g3268 [Phlebia brevispora]